MLTSDVKKYIDLSVLCWLATSDTDNFPNVSPKEVFTWHDDTTFLIAHIASPNSIRNIRSNPKVCVSFIDVFVQKGYKIKGTARVIEKRDTDFEFKAKRLQSLATERFPVLAVIEILVTQVTPILAPSYQFYKATTSEVGQIEGAMKTYHVRACQG
jgi:predicted pyridoxine 5'-phosphate oxidase superfamily flavin-nucleotide-binding protein